MNKEKREKMSSLLKEFTKEQKLGVGTKIGFLDENDDIGKIERLPTGNFGFDLLTNGGFVKNKINELWGPQSCGKTSLILDTIAHTQKTDENTSVLYLPSEKSFDKKYAVDFRGIKEDTAIFEGKTAEQNADLCIKAADPDYGVNILAIDTIQALASEKELFKKADSKKDEPELAAAGKSDMALLPRLFSKFLRMYTSQSSDTLTVILASQVRTDLGQPNPKMIRDKQTGGNAISHYNLLTVEMKRMGKSFWKIGELPRNSYPVSFRLDKAKIMNRSVGDKIIAYCVDGKFDRRYNVIAITRDIGIHDGKSITLESGETLKFKSIARMIKELPDEAVNYLEKKAYEVFPGGAQIDDTTESTDGGTTENTETVL